MSPDHRRLQRLARAQSDLARLLEGRIAAEQRKSDGLARIRQGTAAALARMSTEGLMFYAAALRRLGDLDKAAAEGEAIRRELMGKLLAARTRQEALQRRADALAAVEGRRLLMEDTSEAVIAMQGKATDKRGVMK